jgi:hypothetical protein
LRGRVNRADGDGRSEEFQVGGLNFKPAPTAERTVAREFCRWWQTGSVTDDKDVRAQLEKLDEIERRARELIERPHYILHDGKPVLDPATGEPLRDDEPVLRGIDVGLGVLRLRAQILGLDAPQRHHLVDESGNTIDITQLMPLLRRFGIAND